MTPPPQTISVIVPAYNEREGLAHVLPRLTETLNSSGWTYEIILVDDGSTDGGTDQPLPSGIKLLRSPIRRGYGNSLMWGIRSAQYPWIATLDADGTYPVEELPNLLPPTSAFDMVIGARTGAHYWKKQLHFPARLLFLWMAEFVCGEKIPDVNSGLRVFKKTLLDKLPIVCPGFSFSTTLTISALSLHRPVHFVPIR
ncbi:MAG TPA: glycosyltransferase family 2 protein, partial [Elusimicrobiota bacterium]|nr:glycosyltransferase family 2 protein [Elusimicrobiota bacterium]